MIEPQFATAKEITRINVLIAALNAVMLPPESPVALDGVLIDSNGEELGRIEYNGDVKQYVWVLA